MASKVKNQINMNQNSFGALVTHLPIAIIGFVQLFSIGSSPFLLLVIFH